MSKAHLPDSLYQQASRRRVLLVTNRAIEVSGPGELVESVLVVVDKFLDDVEVLRSTRNAR